MASNSETGHSVNISNFKLLIDKCNAMGAAYNPSNTTLTVGAMTALWNSADEAHKTHTTAVQNAKNPINDRQILFEKAEKLSTRVLNYFKSTAATAKVKADAKGLADRMRGMGVKVNKLPDGSADPKDVSNSHQGFVQRADTFIQLADLLASDGNYLPNETDLKVDGLKELGQDLKKKNEIIGGVLAPLGASRIKRDKALYEDVTGMLSVAKDSKNYVKSVFGVTAAETKSVTSIKFSK